jgi:2,3-bisphosphoglycerate-dependent phosphoglycerate mutase
MSKVWLMTLFFLLSVWTVGQAQISTFIIVRHAEKMADGSKDPDLSSEGKKRAEALNQMLIKLKINQIYATEFKRTQQTAEITAQNQNLKVQSYSAKPDKNFIEKIKQENEGKIALIVGHSNTVNEIINLLTNTQAYSALADNEYRNIFIVNLHKSGESQVQIWQYPF